MLSWGRVSDARALLNLAEELTARSPERLVVLSLLLLKSTMGDWAAQSPVDVPADFVRQFVELLVTKLLPLRPIDFEKWAEDPEEWMNEEEADRWEFELRVSGVERTASRPHAIDLVCAQPCAEHVLQSLLNHYKDELGPSMKQLIRDTLSRCRSYQGSRIRR